MVLGNTPIVFVHQGVIPVPEYTKYAIEQATLWNPNNKIVLLTNDTSFKYTATNYCMINTDDIPITSQLQKFREKTKLDNAFRGGFWRYTAERVLILQAWMKHMNVNKVLHMENDTLIYCDIQKDLEKYNQIPMVFTSMGSKNEHLLNFLLVNDVSVLEKFCDLLAEGNYTNEMNAAFKFKEQNPELVGLFPYRPDSESSYVMDAAPIGQYIGGPDPRNLNKAVGTLTEGFVNENADFKCSGYKITEHIDNNKKYYKINDKKINCLHVHSKRLDVFMSSKSIDEFIKDKYEPFFPKYKDKQDSATLCNYTEGYTPGLVKSDCFYTHINYHTMKRALIEVVKNNPSKTYMVVETGCAAHGTKSTILWDSFVNYFGGNVVSVDLNPDAVKYTQSKVSSKTSVVCSDSLLHLPKLTENIDFLYLDSYDVDYLDPKASAEHHLKEFNCIKHLLHKGSIVLIDDTPVSPEWLDNGIYNHLYNKLKHIFDPNMCGKGSLVNIELEKMGASKIMHEYQTLWVL